MLIAKDLPKYQSPKESSITSLPFVFDSHGKGRAIIGLYVCDLEDQSPVPLQYGIHYLATSAGVALIY